MQDGPFPPPPTGRRSYIPLCSGIVGMMLGGSALALLSERFQESFAGNIWPAVVVGVFSGFITGLLVGRRVAAMRNQTGSPVFGTPPRPVPRNRREIARPSHFSVRDRGSSLRIRFRWIWRIFPKAASLCFLWTSFLVCWYWGALRTPEPRIMWFAIVWSVPFVAVGLLLVYATLAGLLNRTVIKAGSEFIIVRHGPVPWWGNRRRRIAELERLYCEKDTDPETEGWTHVYGVYALTKEAGKVDLITDLDSAEALFIKQELERWLNNRGHGVGPEVHS